MEKIKNLKKLFKKNNIDGYIVPKNDEFFGEYIPENKDNLKFISKFSGSYGFALILKKKNYLFVDGRYTLQANIQCGNQFKIMTIPKKLPVDIIKNKKLSVGYDPKLYTELMLVRLFQKSKCKLVPIENNLIDKLRKRKKIKKVNKFFTLEEKNVGVNHTKKISILSKKMNQNRIDLQFISAAENVAWILNLRGKDGDFTPIPNSYLTIDNKKNINLFCDLKKIDRKIKLVLKNINIIEIKDIEKFLNKIKNKKIQIDRLSCSVLFKNILIKNNKIFELNDMTYILKAIKNKIEIKNIKQSHISDGVALTKFLFWIKNNFKKKKITEISAQEKLFRFRKQNKNFKMLSFPTISGSGPNGAIIHYKADEKNNRLLREGDLYLVDSGGQYNFGTTDVTRTISLDNKSVKIKNIYTRVLQGHIAVADYKIKNSTSGSEIDEAARKPLNKIGLNYAHGTGHGVGYFLNVHEGPHGISRGNKIKLQEGMILSNEPGYYEKKKFGIRIENLVCIKKEKNKLKFENLTMAPIDKSLVVKKLLNKKEIKWVNDYHSNVFKKLKNFMNSSELVELKTACSNI